MKTSKIVTNFHTPETTTIATIETDIRSGTTIATGTLEGEWKTSQMIESVMRHRATIGRAIRAIEELSIERWYILENDMAKDILRDFYREVDERAQSIMAKTGVVSGAHYNAMKQLLAERGIEV